MSTTTEVVVPVPPPAQDNPPFDFITWFELNRTRIFAGVAVIVVAVVIFLFIRWQTEQKEMAAAQALTSALNNTSAAGQPNAAALLDVASAHSGTRAAERARILGAGRLFVDGRYADSKTQFESFTTDFGNSSLFPTALLGIASSLDALNKTNEAVVAYQRLISSFPNDPLAWRARLNKARLHEAAHQPQVALALYDEISRSQSAGELVQEAAILRSRLLALNPELEMPASVTNSVHVGPAPSIP